MQSCSHAHAHAQKIPPSSPFILPLQPPQPDLKGTSNFYARVYNEFDYFEIPLLRYAPNAWLHFWNQLPGLTFVQWLSSSMTFSIHKPASWCDWQSL